MGPNRFEMGLVLRRIFLDGRAANVVQMYTVNSVGTKSAHD